MLYSWNNASSIFLPQHIFLLDLSRMANCKRTSVALAAWCWIECLPDWDGVLWDRERFSWLEIRKHNDKSCDTNHHSCTRQFLSTDIFQVLLGKTEQTLKNYRIPGEKNHITHPAWNEWYCISLDHRHLHRSWTRLQWDLWSSHRANISIDQLPVSVASLHIVPVHPCTMFYACHYGEMKIVGKYDIVTAWIARKSIQVVKCARAS